MTFARSRPEGGALSNSALVDLGGETLVFDTSLTPQAAQDLCHAAAEVTGRAPSLAANSHWHLDHTLGNQAFTAVPTYGTQRTREILREKLGELSTQISVPVLEKRVGELEEMLARSPPGAVRMYLRGVLGTNRWLLDAAPTLRIVPPNHGFQGKVRLPGSRHAELVSFGGGHTESDALLYLPDDGLLATGDLVVVETHPNVRSGDAEQWLGILRRMEQLRPERVVPGHGPVGGPEAIEAVRDYLSTLLKLAQGFGPVDIPPRFAGWAMADQFEGNVEFLRSQRSR
ncbi:MAG: MBL fold metallo-hydrolase [Candidatus Lutacidiplasmatales archaeon]